MARLKGTGLAVAAARNRPEKAGEANPRIISIDLESHTFGTMRPVGAYIGLMLQLEDEHAVKERG